MYTEIVKAEGHLIDSQILTEVFDTVIACGASYEVIEFKIGRTNEEPSQLQLQIMAQTATTLEQILGDLMLLGCYPVAEDNAKTVEADMDGVALMIFIPQPIKRQWFATAGSG